MFLLQLCEFGVYALDSVVVSRNVHFINTIRRTSSLLLLPHTLSVPLHQYKCLTECMNAVEVFLPHL